MTATVRKWPKRCRACGYDVFGLWRGIVLLALWCVRCDMPDGGYQNEGR